jgi:replicative DNA helicase
MRAEQLATRLLSGEARISGDRIRRGDIAQKDVDKFMQISQETTSLPIQIDDTPAITMSALRTRCRQLKRTKGLALVIVDYLQLMRPAAGTKPESRELEISLITQGLKASSTFCPSPSAMPSSSTGRVVLRKKVCTGLSSRNASSSAARASVGSGRAKGRSTTVELASLASRRSGGCRRPR